MAWRILGRLDEGTQPKKGTAMHTSRNLQNTHVWTKRFKWWTVLSAISERHQTEWCKYQLGGARSILFETGDINHLNTESTGKFWCLFCKLDEGPYWDKEPSWCGTAFWEESRALLHKVFGCCETVQHHARRKSWHLEDSLQWHCDFQAAREQDISSAWRATTGRTWMRVACGEKELIVRMEMDTTVLLLAIHIYSHGAAHLHITSWLSFSLACTLQTHQSLKANIHLYRNYPNCWGIAQWNCRTGAMCHGKLPFCLWGSPTSHWTKAISISYRACPKQLWPLPPLKWISGLQYITWYQVSFCLPASNQKRTNKMAWTFVDSWFRLSTDPASSSWLECCKLWKPSDSIMSGSYPWIVHPPTNSLRKNSQHLWWFTFSFQQTINSPGSVSSVIPKSWPHWRNPWLLMASSVSPDSLRFTPIAESQDQRCILISYLCTCQKAFPTLAIETKWGRGAADAHPERPPGWSTWKFCFRSWTPPFVWGISMNRQSVNAAYLFWRLQAG